MAAWVKVLLFVLGGVGAAGGTAYVTGLLDPWLAPPPPAVVAPAPEAAPETPPAAETAQPSAAEDAAPEAAQKQEEPGDPVTTAKRDRLAPPVFDILRVEPDGSVLIAGKAGAKAVVDVLSGETVLGTATAGEEGDFVIVLERPLAPGDYRLALRATVPGDEAVLSAGTAIVSIPEAKDGQVLAMVEEPGAPAQLVTVPQVKDAAAATPDEPAAEPETAEEPAETATEQPEPDTPAQPEAEAEVAVLSPAAEEAKEPVEEPAPPAGQQPAATHTIAVEAVEIEGGTIFVAGRAEPGRTVRVYADALLLGDAVVSDGGRFLVEARRALAVGNYLIRADLIDKDGSVLARAAVPFEREPGEAIAAVAPTAPSAPAQEAHPAEAAAEEPAEETQAETEVAATPTAPAAPAAPAQPTAPAQPAVGDEAATAPPLQRVDGAVIIRRGDSLWRISRRVYGHGIRYSTIYLANQDQIRNPDRIWPGQVFTVPHETPEGEQADLEAVGEQAVKPQE